MRVMHVMGGGDVGGAKTQIMNTVTGLARRNEVMLISFRAGPFADEARERGIDVRVIERHNPFRAARAMRDLVDKFQPDIIHCHGGRANLMGAMVRRTRRVPVLTTVHSDYKLDYLGNPFKQHTFGAANAVALRFLDFYQPVADRMARTLIERGAITREEGARFRVSAGANRYRVEVPADPYAIGEYRCTCPWWMKHRGGRGPCKHVLAVSIMLKEES